MPFNDNHKRYLLASFQHIDKQLAAAAAALGPEDGDVLFPQHAPDATPTQRKVIADYLASFRSVAGQFLRSAGIAPQGPTTSALWAFRVALNFVWVTLAEIEPKTLAGYGPLDAESAAETTRVQTQLLAILRQTAEYIEGGLGGDIAPRIARLDQTRNEVALLRELERIISTHGLVEFRATLSWLLERFERPWLEVAFFGRVSCGKSSLLNTLLGREVLPTGVTPVTAVPTRIVPGEPQRASVRFATLPPQEIELEQLADFVTEGRNHDNEKNVVDILVRLVSPRLSEGVCFVDTPGLGSLATAGAAQSLAYLPRCDVGVLLIDAGATITEEDISVARTLLESGAILAPVVSKADLLDPADVRTVTNYVRTQLRAALGIDCRVSPVSVKEDSALSALTWFSRELAPRLSERRSLLHASLRRKVGALREAVTVTMKLRAHDHAPGSDSAPRSSNTARVLADARGSIEQARKRTRQLADEMVRRRATLIDVMAEALADAWETGERPDSSPGELSPSPSPVTPPPEARALLSLAQEMDRHGAAFGAVIDGTRNDLERALEAAAQETAARVASDDHFPPPAPRPLFDPERLLRGIRLRPGVLSLFGRKARVADARRQLAARIEAAMARVVESHSNALKRWALAELNALETAFDASAAAFSAIERSRNARAPSGPSDAPGGLDADLRLLMGWEGAVPVPGEFSKLAQVSHA